MSDIDPVEKITVAIFPVDNPRVSEAQKAGILFWLSRWKATHVIYPGDDAVGKEIAGTSGQLAAVSTYAFSEFNEYPSLGDALKDAGVMELDAVIVLGNNHLGAPRGDHQFVVTDINGRQFCSEDPYLFVLPRKGRPTRSKLMSILLNARNEGLLSPEESLAAFEAGKLSPELEERLLKHQMMLAGVISPDQD